MLVNYISNIDFKNEYKLKKDMLVNYISNINFNNKFKDIKQGFISIYNIRDMVYINTFFAKTLFSYSILYSRIQKIYNKIPGLNNTIKYLCYGLNFLYSKLINKRIEPYKNNWFSISNLKRDFSITKPLFIKENEFKYIFEYKFFESFHYNISTIESFENFYNIQNQSMIISPMDVETLLILKLDDKVLVRTLIRSLSKNYFEKSKKTYFISNIISKVRFLNVEYTHPRMNKTITLNIGREYFIEGNEILSSAFIKRFLEYQRNSYFFDLNYVIKIVDNNLNFFELRSEEYIIVEKDKFKIMNIFLSREPTVPLRHIFLSREPTVPLRPLPSPL